jgi:purine-nucleoside phosphorylase
MTTFEKFFGINPDKIKENCIICPTNDASLFTEENSETAKGIFFKIDNLKDETVISVKNNFLLADCILLLMETPCKNIFLFGPCGVLPPFNRGDKLIIEKAFNFESASTFLDFPSDVKVCFPDKALFDKFHSFSRLCRVPSQQTMSIKWPKLKTSACATVNSLLLEKLHIPELKKMEISSLDMESSIVFSCAEKIGKKAIAILYATDSPEKTNLFVPLNEKEKETLKTSKKQLAQTLKSFIHDKKN